MEDDKHMLSELKQQLVKKGMKNLHFIGVSTFIENDHEREKEQLYSSTATLGNNVYCSYSMY